MISRRGLLAATGLASVSAVSGRVQAASIPEAASTKTNTMQPPLFPSSGPDYQPVMTLNGWTLAVADERRMEGISPGGRTGDARDRARDEGESLGLQRPIAGPDHRGGRGRPGAHLRHQPPAGAHQHSLARPALCRTAWTAWPGSLSRRSSPDRPSYTSSPPARGNIHVPPALPMRPRRWPWA